MVSALQIVDFTFQNILIVIEHAQKILIDVGGKEAKHS